MATVKAVSSKAPIGTAIDYVTKEEKTEQSLQSGIGCEPETAFDEMQATKTAWNKTGGREYLHFVQSFKPGETTAEQAQAIGKELAENNAAWKGFEVLIVTHDDREHIHNHFIVNSVSYEDGHKIQSRPQDLENLKAQSDRICSREKLSVIDRSKPRTAENVTAYKKDTYKILKEAEQGQAESYVQNIAAAIVEVKQTAKSQEEFIQKMNDRGYMVDWQENHKNITFTDIEREQHGEKKCKVRNSRLEKYYNIDFSKEGMLNEFEANREKSESKGAEQPSLTAAVRTIQEQLSAEDGRMQRIEETLAKIGTDRDAAQRVAAENIRSRSGRTGTAPDGEPETKDEPAGERKTDREIEPTSGNSFEALFRETERIRNEYEERADKQQEVCADLATELAGAREEITREGIRAAEVGERIAGERNGAAGVKGKQQYIDRECGGIAEDCARVGAEQQHITGEQRSIAEKLREFAERIKEQVSQIIHHRGKGR